MSEIYKVSAKTVDEAMDLAEKLYGGAKKELSYDIEALPKKGFLGIGAKDAVIRVTVSTIEDEAKTEKKPSAPAKAQTKPAAAPDNTSSRNKKSTNETAGAKQSASVKPSVSEKKEETVTETSATPSAPANEAKSDAPAKEHRVQKNASCAKAQPKKPATPAAKEAEAEKTCRVKTSDNEKKHAVSREEMDFAKSFISSVICEMHLNAAVEEISAPDGEEYITEEGFDVYPAVNIVGEDTGALIGHHGETLDALQYLVNLALYRNVASNGKTRENIKITVDIANYRAKREETLRALAVRMANRAVKYKKNVFLEPMNPYERRIIHSELQDFPNVATHSVGSDVNRKIIITYEGADKQLQNKRRRNDRRTQPMRNAAPGKEKSNANVPENAASENTAPSDTPVAMPLPTLDDIDA